LTCFRFFYSSLRSLIKASALFPSPIRSEARDLLPPLLSSEDILTHCRLLCLPIRLSFDFNVLSEFPCLTSIHKAASPPCCPISSILSGNPVVLLSVVRPPSFFQLALCGLRVPPLQLLDLDTASIPEGRTAPFFFFSLSHPFHYDLPAFFMILRTPLKSWCGCHSPSATLYLRIEVALCYFLSFATIIVGYLLSASLRLDGLKHNIADLPRVVPATPHFERHSNPVFRRQSI